MKLGIGVGIVVAVTASLVAQQGPPAALAPAPETAKEVHLSNVKQLTFGGENAEAYFSFDGQELIFQSTRDGGECDQIYAMRIDGSQRAPRQLGRGPHDLLVLHARQASTSFTPPPTLAARRARRGRTSAAAMCGRSTSTYDIFKARADGTGITRLTSTPGYDAEATIGPTAGSSSPACATATWRSTR